MSDFRDQERLENLRRRLYDRGSKAHSSQRHRLRNEERMVRTDWGNDPLPRTVVDAPDPRPAIAQSAAPSPQTSAAAVSDGSSASMETAVSTISHTAEVRPSVSNNPRASVASSTPAPPQTPRDFSEHTKPARRYRWYILLGSLFIFIGMAIFSSIYLFFGANQISGDNIAVALSGPTTLGGGEELPLQISVTNQNSVPIESATAIIRFPNGTQTAGDPTAPLFEERISLGTIEPGAVRTESIKATVFGEESTKQSITALVEYRVANSNSLFEKTAPSHVYTITSAPVGIRIGGASQVASGQEIPLTVTLNSNASNPLTNILVQAEYPNNFSYARSEPGPVFGQNVWRIDELNSGGSESITVYGIPTGLTGEDARIRFTVGVSSPNDEFRLSGQLVQTTYNITIERPFIDVVVEVDGDRDGQAIVAEGAPVPFTLEITNTLDEVINDLSLVAKPSGNVFSDESIRGVGSGFYDSVADEILWEVAGNENFAEVLPGETRTVSFTLAPTTIIPSASMSVSVDARARRVVDGEASEVLIGAGDGEVQYHGMADLAREAAYDTGPFDDVGPIPPVAEQPTSYTLSLAVTAGTNNVNDAVVLASFPQYVTWQGEVEGPGSFEYNPISKQLRWVAGGVESQETKILSFQVSITPSLTQVGNTLVLMQRQTLQANDAFTGTLLRASAPAVTTELSTEAGFEPQNGRVVRP